MAKKTYDPTTKFSRSQIMMVRRMVEAGATTADLALALAVAPRTVRRYFGDTLRHKPGTVPNAYTLQQRQFVEAMAGFAIPQEDIARVLAIAPDTLRADFAEELAVGPVKMNVRVVTNLFKMTEQHPAAAIYWTKARLGWRDRTVVQVNHRHSGGVEHQHSVSVDVREAVASLTPEGRAGLRRALEDLGARSATKLSVVQGGAA